MRAVLELIAEPPSSPWCESSCSGRKVEAVVFSVGSKNRDCMVCSHVDFWNFLIIGIENIRLSHPRPPLRCCQCCCWEMYLSHVTITSSNVTVISDISWGRIRHDRLQGPGDMVTNVSCGGKLVVLAECPQTQEACLLIVGGDEPAPATGTDCL